MGFETSKLLLLPIIFPLLYLIFKLLHKLWIRPLYIQAVLGSQGIKGPSYKFLHGNTKEISSMVAESRSKVPKELSHDIFPRMMPHVYSWIKTYGKIYLSWYGPKPQLVVAELELVKEILTNKDGAYPKTKAEGYVKKWLGDSIVNAEGEKWARNRKLANHAFHGESLKGMLPSMITAVEIMLERWRTHDEGKEIEVFEEFRLLTSDVISRTAFGSSYVEGKNIFKMLMKLGSMIIANAFKIKFPGLEKILRMHDEIESGRLEREIHKCILEIIRKREEKVRSGELDGYGYDYLGLLVKASQESNLSKRILVDEMVQECKTFYVAGHETTTSLLASTCFLLAVHTEWQDKARKEVIELFGGNAPTPDDTSIARLKTMNMIIHESLRVYPPVLNVNRRVAREVRLGKLVLPANIEVSIPILALHHDPEIWGDDVHLFKPERFADGVLKAANNMAGAFLPFGAGPRNCVGLNFAMNEAKIALSMMLQRYEFTLSPTYVHSPIQSITTRPQHGIQIVLHPRRQ